MITGVVLGPEVGKNMPSAAMSYRIIENEGVWVISRTSSSTGLLENFLPPQPDRIKNKPLKTMYLVSLLRL